MNKGGGKVELANVTGKEKRAHVNFECPHYKITTHDIKTMQIHHESKHSKIPYEEDKGHSFVYVSHVVAFDVNVDVRELEKRLKNDLPQALTTDERKYSVNRL
ncbi:hypothetical protein ACFE04_003617 [Oxalis oulophora]